MRRRRREAEGERQVFLLLLTPDASRLTKEVFLIIQGKAYECKENSGIDC